jgi:peptide/nickel transport system permease protein
VSSSTKESTLQRLFQRKVVVVASIVLATIATLAILSPWVIADPNAIVGTDRLLPPSETYWFGTDNFGRDAFARVVVGAKSSMYVGAITALVATTLGTFIAILSSMFPRIDLILMRLVDGIMGFPILVLALSMLAILGPGIQTVVLCLIIVMFPGVTRIVRSTALVVAESPMIESARAIGASNWRIMRKYILPACVTPILIQAAIIFTVAIIVESGLSFIGAGLPPEVPSWGDSLATARNYLDTAWWLWVFPGAALVAVVLSVNLIVDALRDIFDPRELVK